MRRRLVWPRRGLRPVVLYGPLIASALLFYYRFHPWIAATPAAAVVLYLLLGARRLFGPHLFYDPGRLARRGRITVLRMAFLGSLLLGLWWTYYLQPAVLQVSTMSRITQRYSFAFFVLQNLTIVLLTPVYVGSAIAEERERRSLEVLFSTPLRATQIVLGILGGRLLLLSSFMVAALPILSVLQLWGGIDMLLMLGNEINSLLLLVAVGSICILASTLAGSVVWGVAGSYGLLFMPFFFCGVLAATDFGSPFVLFDVRAGGAARLTVQHSLVPLAIIYLGLSLFSVVMAILCLRPENFTAPDSWAGAERQTSSADPQPAPLTLGEEKLARLPRLPPIGDNALFWKECQAGGRAMIFSPFGLSFLILFILYGVPFFLSQPERAAQQQTLQVYYYAFVLFYAVGAAFRATAAVAREREQQTLDVLLQIPEERRTIFIAKCHGAMRKGWPWLILVGANLLLGVCLGLYPPLLALWMLIAPWPLVLLIAGTGMLLSVSVGTVLRARLTLTILILAAFFGIGRGLYNPIPGLPYAVGFPDGSHIAADELPAWLEPTGLYALTLGWQAAYLALALVLAAAALRVFLGRGVSLPLGGVRYRRRPLASRPSSST